MKIKIFLTTFYNYFSKSIPFLLLVNALYSNHDAWESRKEVLALKQQIQLMQVELKTFKVQVITDAPLLVNPIHTYDYIFYSKVFLGIAIAGAAIFIIFYSRGGSFPGTDVVPLDSSSPLALNTISFADQTSLNTSVSLNNVISNTNRLGNEIAPLSKHCFLAKMTDPDYLPTYSFNDWDTFV